MAVLVMAAGCSMQASEPRPAFVVIGDSIAEGHPALHGPRHKTVHVMPGQRSAEPGQLAYELSPTHPWANMGLGNQTTSDVRASWARDTIDAKTIYLHAGINDVAFGVPGYRENMVYFARDCRKRGITLILANIGPETDPGFTDAEVDLARGHNAWLADDFHRQFPEVILVDYLGWATGGSRDFRDLLAGAFADDLHPNRDGYRLYAHFILATVAAHRN